MKKQIILACALSSPLLYAEITNFQAKFNDTINTNPALKTRVHQENAELRAPSPDLCNLYSAVYCCSSQLLAQTKQDVQDSDPELAHYIAEHTSAIEKRFEEMATSYAQDVTSAINANVTAGAIAYLSYHNELTKYENVIAIFYADWFQPYQLMRPALEILSEKYTDKIQFMEINTNTMHIFGIDIKHIPTLIFYKDGAAVDIHVGIGINEDIFQEIARCTADSNPNATQEELAALIRAQVTAEIERILDGIIQDHFEK